MHSPVDIRETISHQAPLQEGTWHGLSLPRRQGTCRRRCTRSISETPSIKLAGIEHVAGYLHGGKYHSSSRCRRCPINRVSSKAEVRLPSTFPTGCTKSIASNHIHETPWYDGRGRRNGRVTRRLCTIAGELIWLHSKWTTVPPSCVIADAIYPFDVLLLFV